MQVLHLNPHASDRARERGLHLEVLWNLEPEVRITSSRTSDVSRVRLPPPLLGSVSGEAYRKRYWYPRPRDRWKGFFRNTFFGPSRAAAEYRNLERLHGAGLSRVRPLAYGEERTLRFLRRALLLTEFRPRTETLEAFLGKAAFHRQPRRARNSFLSALGRWIARLHSRGYRDRDLFARNVLVHHEDPGPAFSKIDAPKGRGGLFAPGYGKPFTRDLADLDGDLRHLLSRTDRIRCLLAYLGAGRVDGEVRRTVARILRLQEKGKGRRPIAGGDRK